MTKLERLLSVILIALIATMVIIGQSNRALNHQVAAERELIEKQNHLIDSLHSELFIANSTLGRWELSLDYLKEVDPNGFVKFSQFYDHETE